MKTSLAIKLVALLVAAGYPVVAFAEFVGASIPAQVNAENALGVFAVAVTVLTLIADYPRRSRSLTVAPAVEPAAVCACTRPCECHRLAA